jgi:ankyrin repeat protein
MQMIQNGFDPNKSDYDKRTALMLATVEGHKDVINTLLGNALPYS